MHVLQCNQRPIEYFGNVLSLTRVAHSVETMVSGRIRYDFPRRQNQDIAECLAISEATVRTHVSHILTKLGLSSRTQAALYALRTGLASLDVSDVIP